MKKLLWVILLLTSSVAFAATAIWTGRMEQVQTASGTYSWKCEYDLNGNKFWQVFTTFCPPSIEVQ
jgi:hypothetical protein